MNFRGFIIININTDYDIKKGDTLRNYRYNSAIIFSFLVLIVVNIVKKSYPGVITIQLLLL